jgi:hypothetical protein
MIKEYIRARKTICGLCVVYVHYLFFGTSCVDGGCDGLCMLDYVCVARVVFVRGCVVVKLYIVVVIYVGNCIEGEHVSVSSSG